jgi:ABC-type transport system substrate-binding protein
MKLIQIRLRKSVPFWFIGNLITLNQENEVSDFISIDSLNDDIRKVIDLSIYRQEINVFDYDGNIVKKLDDTKYISGQFSVSTDDVSGNDEENDLLPEMISVTMDEQETEEKQVEEKRPVEPGEEDIENAKILLEQNGNTVKKTIKNITRTDDNLLLLRACLNEEQLNKNRKGIISTIKKILSEC